MKSKTLHIESVRIRASNLSRAEAVRLGQLVAQRLAEVGHGRSQRISGISLRVIRGSVETTASKIADKVKGRIR